MEGGGEARLPGVEGREEAVARALERPRFELVPVKGALEEARHLPSGAEVTITCSPALGIENTLDLAEKLAGRGFRVVPHLSARLVRGEGHLREILRRMDLAGLRDAFVVGGDVKRPAGPFAGGADLLRAMAEREHGIERIGLPAYPEGHPLVPDGTLTRALAEKEPFASYLVTQICFDPDAILGWLVGIRRDGIRLPAYIGVPGVVERGRLIRISLRIGIGTSVRYLRKQHGSLGRLMLHGGYSPDHLVQALAPRVGDPEYGIRGFHINTFNQVAYTERWRKDLLAAASDEGA